MFRSVALAGVLASALLFSSAAPAATDEELAAIREQIRDLKASYEARIEALEKRLQDTEAGIAKARDRPDVAPVEVAAAPPVPAPVAAPTSANAFNPAISAVLQGVYANLSQDPHRYAIYGFAPSGDIAPAKRGLSLAESELGFSANVDDKVYGNLIFSLTPENTVSVEEAYGVLTALPGGLTPKFGRFKSSIGYLNDQHQHVWDFYDAPLPYQAFLGGQFTSDGVQLKWIAPTDLFIELGAEIGDGKNFPGADRNNNGIGNVAAYAHLGGDIGVSNTWRAGLSYLGLRPRDRQGAETTVAGADTQTAFSGNSDLAIADFVWKYAPNGNAQDTNFKLQGEYFWRKENGELAFDRDGAVGLANTSDYSSRQSGWYVDGVYQFRPQWRVGARYDRLDSGTVNLGTNDPFLATSAFTPQRYAVMFDYTPSEFSRFRVQWQQSRIRPNATDNELFIQYILSLGAHGAHKY